jgi:hypothetical protein
MNEMFRRIYDMAQQKVELRSLPGFVVTIADYMDKATRCADLEINMVAFMSEVMMEADYK